MTLMSASFLLVVAGIVIAGPWLTVLAGRATLQFGRGATARLAGWRPSADPAAAFRSISGLIHAVLLASLISGVLPSVIGGQSRKSLPQPAGTVSAYLGGRQAPGLPPGPAQRLLHNLANFPAYASLWASLWITTRSGPSACSVRPERARAARVRTPRTTAAEQGRSIPRQQRRGSLAQTSTRTCRRLGP